MENRGKTMEHCGKLWNMMEPMTENVMEHPGAALNFTKKVAH